MEYLTTYGWAILVVMIVGGAIWKLGILNTSTAATTATGFGAVKPLLPTCKVANNGIAKNTAQYWSGCGADGYGGFSCDFINGAGQNILISRVDITINGQGCNYIEAGNNLDDTTICDTGECPPGVYDIWEYCYQTGCFPDAEYLFCEYQDNSGNDVVPVTAGSTFTAAITKWGLVNCGPNWKCPCGALNPGDPYTAVIDITYETNIGGQTEVRHSIGTVRGTAE